AEKDETNEKDVVLRFAALGDAEPKPEPQFPHMAAVVDDVNRLAQTSRMDFVIGVGDIAHKGTRIQYENATSVLQALQPPFYPIMGNEEHGSTVKRFLRYANRWGGEKAGITDASYVVETDQVALVFASPDFDRDFKDRGIDWMLAQIRRLQPKPVLLVVHGAQVGVYPENPDKGITHERFAEVTGQPNLAAIISGDLHMDMDRVEHSKQIDGVHYLHIPALERTKIPDESRHTAMFRVFTVHADGEALVQTYEAGVAEPLRRHDYRFSITPATGPAAAAIRQTAFRFRSDTRQALNADAGWRSSTAQFRDLVIEGNPASPRVSIIASEVFQHRAETSDLLNGSGAPFSGGAGISFADSTPVWSTAEGHGEWEWPLVIRRFADGAVTNEAGDTFEFRMADAQGQAVASPRVPGVTVSVPPGHMGGTFVETPARIGPWQASNGDLYFLMEPSETYNALMTVKSSDGGKTWREVDGINRPETGDLEGVASALAEGRIHILHQTSDDVWYHVFNTSDHQRAPDVWAIRDERLASP
ncbi:MAG: hypothetical protein VBE63_28965, partial [Lamprobacter sp.]|uniref:metallophosphoesterase family protein n=1 Tax=Lamprobacter sp. TaxID=3100796 RepID=UPI002B257B09